MAKRKKTGTGEIEAADLFGEVPSSIHGEHIAAQIDALLYKKNTSEEYREAVHSIFKGEAEAEKDTGLWNLLSYLETETDFFYAPASTRYHGAAECGLVKHSLAVLSKCLYLAPAFLGNDYNRYHLIVSCLFHDLCKVNMYEKKTRNAKNEKTGVWEQVPCYMVRADYISFGHGIESMLRITKFMKLPQAWLHAIRWHMGAYDISGSDDISYKKALSRYKEVLLLHTADMQAGVVDGV